MTAKTFTDQEICQIAAALRVGSSHVKPDALHIQQAGDVIAQLYAEVGHLRAIKANVETYYDRLVDDAAEEAAGTDTVARDIYTDVRQNLAGALVDVAW